MVAYWQRDKSYQKIAVTRGFITLNNDKNHLWISLGASEHEIIENFVSWVCVRVFLDHLGSYDVSKWDGLEAQIIVPSSWIFFKSEA